MKFSSLTIFFIIFFAIFSVTSLSQDIGVSPGKVDIGKVEKGSTKLVNFYIITPSEETLLVKLEPERVNLDAIGNKIINNLSEEDMSSWVKIINNPVELKPINTTGVIKGQRQIGFLIEIPKNAEPGYHLVNIKPTPLMTSETIGPIGSRVVAIIPVKVLLDVIGNVIRRGVILDVETGNYVGNKLEINTYFQNTGTVTISASGTQRFYDKNGELIKEISLGSLYIEPKGIKVFKGFLSKEEISLGDYNVYTVINYKTGTAEKSSLITIPSPPTALVTRAEEVFIPLLVIIVVIVFVVSVIIYRRIE